MRHITKQGFTLIELLLVIAIIGILATTVLTSVQNARVGAREAAIKSALGQIRISQEVWYDQNRTYGTPTQVAPNTVTQITRDSGVAPKGGGNVTAYAVAADLPSGSSAGAWCVDSSGRNGAITDAQFSAMAATATACP
jgi:prepilin-type N-terminal cleavage/methylation domain-containing protein